MVKGCPASRTVDPRAEFSGACGQALQGLYVGSPTSHSRPSIC